MHERAVVHLQWVEDGHPWADHGHAGLGRTGCGEELTRMRALAVRSAGHGGRVQCEAPGAERSRVWRGAGGCGRMHTGADRRWSGRTLPLLPAHGTSPVGRRARVLCVRGWEAVRPRTPSSGAGWRTRDRSVRGQGERPRPRQSLGAAAFFGFLGGALDQRRNARR